MTTDKLLELFNSHTGTVNVLWGFFSTVALAVLGFAYKDGMPVGGRPLRVALSFGFALFAAGNCVAMHRSSKVLYQLSIVIRNRAGGDAEFAEVLRAYKAVPPGQILTTQILFTICVIAGLWFPILLTRGKSGHRIHA